MPKPSDENLCSLGKRTLSPPDSSLDDLELESCIEELDNLGDLTDSGLSRKPHFLDYDNKPPAELVEQHHKWNGVALANEAATDEPECEPLYKHVPAEPVQPLPVVPLLHMNVSYEATTALNILPTSTTKKQPPAVGSRGGTWPLKERVSATRRQHHSLNRDLAEVGPKMECVYSLLSMLGSTNVLEMSSKFLELSRNDEKCSALRRSGCVPLLVHIIHNEPNEAARRNARHALVNVIRCNVDETSVRRELKVLRLIDQLIDYTDLLKEQTAGSEPSADRQTGMSGPPEQERHPIQAIGTLAKISYDEEHRHAMCQFGALQTIASLIQLDHLAHGPVPDALKCIEMRRYASMVLTNLTFGQGNNKALLCANREFMRALVAQLECAELVQVTASVLRNLSWRADTVTKQTLVEIGTVKVLTEAAMRCTVENTLKSILSALWNLSNHCSQNRSRICEVTGALEFLIELLTYEAPSKTMSIVENAGGILRNISSHIAQCEPYRRVLRERNCLKILLDQLKSPSLTVVSNACGTLGNLSSDNGEDQQFLRENGAVPMLRSLIYSKHNIISNGSRLALKNLQNRPVTGVDQQPPVVAASLTNGGVLPVKGVPTGKTPEPVGNGLPGLNVRKQRAMEQELGCAFYARKDEDLSEDESAGGKVSDDAEPVDPSAVRVELVDERLAAEPETPINYGLKDGMQQSSYDYQETDIDQLTDYSLRYAENQSESEDEKGDTYRADPVNMLIPEDSVKCYYTEGTPQIISSATSMSDLRGASVVGATSAAAGTASGVSNAGDSSAVPFKQPSVVKSNPIPIGRGQVAGDDLGCNTPDKPYNYCEEGTPDFSRDASLGILDLPHDGGGGKQPEEDGKPVPPGVDLLEAVDATESGLPGPTTGKSVSFLNTADETPLMFSRTSSMGSLSSAEPACTDDKSSIVSEFSRMASGVMSPSELPDSPTETVAHSPRRCPPKEKPVPERPPVTSAFADTVSKFNVEHTPAQFSCATSLSNLSIELEDSRDVTVEDGTGGERVDRRSSPVLPNPAELLANAGEVGDVPGSDGDSDAGEDDELLASCISIGMSSVVARSAAAKKNPPTATFPHLATGQSTGEPVDPVEPHFLRYRERGGDDSDDSSNLSDNNDRLLEECILSGMPKPKHPIDGLHSGSLLPRPLQLVDSERDPFKMMRNPVHLQPLMANDELNPFHVEDSPCNFSTVSTLSELTVASDTMAVQRTPRGRMEPIATGLVSSPSIESEADEYILDEAILAGIAGKGDKAHQRRSKSHGTVPEPTGGQRPPAGGSIPDDSDQEGDYQLLVECIRTGMRSSMKPPEEPVPRPDQQPGPSTLPAGSKNLRTTPVTSKDVGACEASAGVGKARPSRTPPVGGQRVAPSERLAGRYQRASSTTDNSRTGQPPVSSGCNSNNNAAGTCPGVTRTENEGIGCEVGALSGLSSCSGESQVLPVDRYIDGEASVADKHKNPELMLQSVERLTQALVSQAEDVWATPALEPAPVQFMIGGKVSGSSVTVGLEKRKLPSGCVVPATFGFTALEALILEDAPQTDLNNVELNSLSRMSLSELSSHRAELPDVLTGVRLGRNSAKLMPPGGDGGLQALLCADNKMEQELDLLSRISVPSIVEEIDQLKMDSVVEKDWSLDECNAPKLEVVSKPSVQPRLRDPSRFQTQLIEWPVFADNKCLVEEAPPSVVKKEAAAGVGAVVVPAPVRSKLVGVKATEKASPKVVKKNGTTEGVPSQGAFGSRTRPTISKPAEKAPNKIVKKVPTTDTGSVRSRVSGVGKTVEKTPPKTTKVATNVTSKIVKPTLTSRTVQRSSEAKGVKQQQQQQSPTQLTVLTRQSTFTTEKPTVAPLPHIVSAPTTPIKQRKVDGAGLQSSALTTPPVAPLMRAQTTLPRSRIPAPARNPSTPSVRTVPSSAASLRITPRVPPSPLARSNASTSKSRGPSSGLAAKST